MDNRIILAAVIAFLICLGIGPLTIKFLHRLRFGQSIRSQGPASHQAKAGTPTMGGLLIIFGFSVSVFLLAPRNMYSLLVVGISLGYGFLGFLDDFLKTVRKHSLGLRAREKLLWQIALAGGLGLWVLNQASLGSQVFVPFTGMQLDLGWLYIPFVVLVVVSTVNAVNLTDGLDGLAAGTTAIAMLAYVPISLTLGRMELAVFSAAVAGACLGFLWFNSHPAQVFMGDTGSLALGGALAGVAVLTKTELWLLIIGGIFVLETVSVILQVLFFRLTGGRILRMSPLHHHFELSGWQETQVVTRFWIVAAILALMGIGIWYFS